MGEDPRFTAARYAGYPETFASTSAPVGVNAAEGPSPGVAVTPWQSPGGVCSLHGRATRGCVQSAVAPQNVTVLATPICRQTRLPVHRENLAFSRGIRRRLVGAHVADEAWKTEGEPRLLAVFAERPA